MTDSERTPDPMVAINRLPPGSGVIFRHYQLANRKQLAGQLASFCRQRHIKFLVAGDWQLAADVNADGIHLSEHIVRTGKGEGKRLRRKGFIITAAAHSHRSLWDAARTGVDAVIVSPVFQTVSHPQNLPLGIIKFSNMCRKSPVPVYALGGITQNNIGRLQKSGCVGIAGIGLFYR